MDINSKHICYVIHILSACLLKCSEATNHIAIGKDNSIHDPRIWDFNNVSVDHVLRRIEVFSYIS